MWKAAQDASPFRFVYFRVSFFVFFICSDPSLTWNRWQINKIKVCLICVHLRLECVRCDTAYARSYEHGSPWRIGWRVSKHNVLTFSYSSLNISSIPAEEYSSLLRSWCVFWINDEWKFVVFDDVMPEIVEVSEYAQKTPYAFVTVDGEQWQFIKIKIPNALLAAQRSKWTRSRRT